MRSLLAWGDLKSRPQLELHSSWTFLLEGGVVAWGTPGPCFGKLNSGVSPEKCLFLMIRNYFRSVKDLLSDLTSQKFSRMQCFPFLVGHECTEHIHRDRQGGNYTSQVLSLWENGNSIAECWMLLRKYRNDFLIQSTDSSINGEYETTYWIAPVPYLVSLIMNLLNRCSCRKLRDQRGSS